MGCLEDGLNLALALTPTSNPQPSKPNITNINIINKTTFGSSLLSLGLKSSDQYHLLPHQQASNAKRVAEETVGAPASPNSVVSSFSSGRVKRERDISSEETEVERVSSRASDEEEDGGNNTRKKLRLTKEQSALLEESFKQHSTLNPKQKEGLARKLNLRPRQVEVWFQNRRARTKLKQTEMDCEFLKKCCEKLMDENRRLQKELKELKSLKLSQPFHMHMAAATLTMCPSCERIGGNSVAASKNTISMAPKTHLFNSFNNPSAAC